MVRIRSFVSYGFSLFFSLAFFLLFSLVSSPKAFSKLPEIKSKLSAQSSVDGENILLNIEVTVFEAGHSSAPQPPASMFESWEIDNAYTGGRSEYRTQIQGKIQYRKTTRYHFDLRPLKKGLLKIPPFKIKLGSKEYSTQTFEVDVAKVRIGKLARKKPQRRNREKFDAEDLFPDELFDVERERSALGTPDIFVRGIPHKKEVYIGELIKVPYYVFYKNLTITKTEIGRFPSFKGFLKEELDVPKTWVAKPVEINESFYQRGSLIKYAIFPIKEGELEVEPLLFRAELFQSPLGSIIDFFSGSNSLKLNPGQKKLEVRSPSFKILVKDLPPLENKENFKGAVGNYSMSIRASTNEVAVEQPFNLEIELRGAGNVKVLEEPKIVLPGALEKKSSSSEYDFDKDSVGFKRFKVLILPKEKGEHTIPPIKWTFFDPDQEEYVTLEGPEIPLIIEGGRIESEGELNQVAEEENTQKELIIERESGAFVSLESLHSRSLRPLLWGFVFVSYLLFGVFLVVKKRREKKWAALGKTPWVITEKLILKKQSWHPPQLATLIEYWSKEKLSFLLGGSDLNREASHAEFLEALEKEFEGASPALIEKLEHFFKELDELRFSGRRFKEKIETNELFQRAKNVLNLLENQLISQSRDSTIEVD